ncbi:hypothetical protein LUZ60_011849 [Juncus effusus]|nr:hypothetical protein LUZ60_011849 [Juncus effusus]
MEEPNPNDGGGATSRGPPAGGGAGDAEVRKGKSCKGCLYYSSMLNSGARNPVCLGISRSLPQVPGHMVGESESEAKRQGHNLSEFKYSCIGYSVFLENIKNDNNLNNNGEKSEKQVELPFCVGIEILADKRPSHADLPAHVHRDDNKSHAKSRVPRTIGGEEFLGRFQRSAGLVISGVYKNLNKAATYIKENVDDIMYRRPK